MIPTFPVPFADLQIADTIAQAAALIADHSSHAGDWWAGACLVEWRPNLPLDVTGAIAVALGYTNADDAFLHVVHEDEQGVWTVHPAVAALMAHLNATTPGLLWAWSDSHRDDQIIDQLHQCAASLREQKEAA